MVVDSRTGKARNNSISRRLTFMNMLVSGVALLLASTAFFIYDGVTFREGIVHQLSIQSQITGTNTVSALLFDDAKSAEDTLSALKASPHISYAAIDTLDLKPFASYARDPAGAAPEVLKIPPGKTEEHVFENGFVNFARLIVFDGKPTSIVYIQSDLAELAARQQTYMQITAAVLFLSMLAALLVSTLSKRTISEPIAHLVEVARSVSQDKDYSVRAVQPKRPAELLILFEAFNEMLAEIQTRDRALEKAREELERRVEERTAQLAAANKELEAFSYSVSHDLRAPLRHIDGFSTILATKLGAVPPDIEQYLKRIREGAKHMGHLIDDLLHMAQIGRKEVIRRPVDMRALAEAVIRDLQPEYEGRQIRWEIGDLPTLECDQGLMKLVFTNLLSNAVKYSRRSEQAVIEVGQTVQNGNRVIFVRDNGAGFDQQYAHRLFGVFQRLHRADEFEGTGVGLATVQRIIQKHGGRIWAEGKLNEGATFRFTLDPALPDPEHGSLSVME